MIKYGVSALRCRSLRSIVLKNTYHNFQPILGRRHKLCILAHYCQNVAALKCWNCGTLKKSSSDIFCEKCNVIQQPHNTDNYFKIVGIDETFDIDVKLLTKKYRQLQSFLHPDKYSNRSKEEKNISEEYSSIINRAYNILQSPIDRGLHLLSLNGEIIDENENKNMDQKFLMEIMELSEEVEEADTPEELLNLNKKNRRKLEEIGQELSAAFKANDILQAKNVLIKMKYYKSVDTQINSLLRERGIVE